MKKSTMVLVGGEAALTFSRGFRNSEQLIQTQGTRTLTLVTSL